MKTNIIRTVLVDDETRALNRMKILLNNFPEIEILNQIQDPEQGIKFIIENEPDLVFLDVEMPGKNGIEIAEEINRNNLHSKIIFITSHEHYAIEAIKYEAFDYLLKPVSINLLKEVIQRYKTKIQSNLNKREIDIIGLISKGCNSKEIASQLFISHHTVDTYRRIILKKTECRNSSELVMFATKNNLV
jgi:two-component system LytT family response regulator